MPSPDRALVLSGGVGGRMRAKALFKARLMECADCHQIVARTGPVQRYCAPCSSQRDTSRKQAWSAKHKRGPVRPAVRIARASAMVEAGAETRA